MDFSYKPVTGSDRDAVLLDVLHRIHTANLKPSGESRQNDWEQGWGENLQDFIKSNYDIETLVPKYFKPNPVLRLQHQYVQPEKDSQFELNFIKVLRSVLAKQYLGTSPLFLNSGVGPVITWCLLRSSCLKFKFADSIGLRPLFKQSSSLRSISHLPITGRRFDYFEPDNTLEVSEK